MEKMIYVTVYADTTGLLSEYECGRDNLIDLLFPESLVIKYYKENEDCFKGETADELGIPINECTFYNWFTAVYTAEDTDELYDFAVKNGYTPVFGIDKKDAVIYRDDCNFKYIVFEGTYDECRQFGKENDWEYHGNELEILSER